MGTQLMQALAMVFFLQLAGAPPAPTLRHFKEDHLTGADYLRLAADGRYDVIGREHMGIWQLDYGSWSVGADGWTFTSIKTKGRTFRCRVVKVGNRVFLVWAGKDAPGIVIREAKVRGDLAKDPKSTPPYVFFEVAQTVFEAETDKRYPFKFYPEMNEEP